MTTFNTNAPSRSLFDETGGFFAGLAKAFADWRLYRRTLAEFRSMSPRQIEDLGISRFAMRQVAYDSVYGK